MVPLTFLRLEWIHGASPRCDHTIDFAREGRLASRSNTIVIVDMFPPMAIRLPHARFIVPQNELPSFMQRFRTAKPRSSIWDAYLTSEENLVGQIMKVADGSSQASFGIDRTPATARCADHYHPYSEVLGQGLSVWSESLVIRVVGLRFVL